MAGTAKADEFLELLAPIRDALHRFAMRSAWRRDQAADIVQEAVMTAWRQFDVFETGTNFRAWVFKILLNTAYRVNRKTHRAKEVSLDSENFDTAEALEKEDAWLSILENPARVMEALDDRMVKALEQLGPVERECFLLRLLEDFSYKEIAELLDLPMGTVMSHVYRARMKLRERLAQMAIEEGLVRSSDLEST